jgi:hypothetical protein
MERGRLKECFGSHCPDRGEIGRCSEDGTGECRGEREFAAGRPSCAAFGWTSHTKQCCSRWAQGPLVPRETLRRFGRYRSSSMPVRTIFSPYAGQFMLAPADQCRSELLTPLISLCCSKVHCSSAMNEPKGGPGLPSRRVIQLARQQVFARGPNDLLEWPKRSYRP